MRLNKPAPLSVHPFSARFIQERMRLGFPNGSRLALAMGFSHVSIARLENSQSIPGGELLHAFAMQGADINFVLSGYHRVPQEALINLFGKTLPTQEPLHLLGALLCVNNGNAEYCADLNPYLPSSPHHAGVETGWRMAHAAMSSDTTALPGTL